MPRIAVLTPEEIMTILEALQDGLIRRISVAMKAFEVGDTETGMLELEAFDADRMLALRLENL